MTSYSLRDKTVLVTGASSGIGEAMARAFVKRGAFVVLAARSKDKIEALARELENAALAVTADMTRPEDVRRLVTAAAGWRGRLDVLVNNAGFGVWGAFERLPMEVIRENFETNVFGAVACAQAAIPHLRQQGGGCIVNIESVVALRALPMSSSYGATKHALHAFSESMRVELAPDHIKVLSVCPGLIETNFHENRRKVDTDIDTGPRWLYLPAAKCAERIVRAVERRQSRIIITGHAALLALAQRISPWLLDRLTAMSYQKIAGEISS